MEYEHESAAPMRVKQQPADLPNFFRLPLELRLQIYGYLLPNVPVIPPDQRRGIGSGLASLRLDGDLCYAEIMRANRQVSAETTDMLYSKCALGIFLCSLHGLWNGGSAPAYLRGTAHLHLFEADEEFATNLKRFRTLNVEIEMGLFGDEKSRSLKDYINHVNQYLRHSWTIRQGLHIKCDITKLHVFRREETLLSILRRFQSLRSIGTAKVDLEVDEHREESFWRNRRD